MSGASVIFPPSSPTRSRIPVPSSPQPFRRSQSLRLTPTNENSWTTNNDRSQHCDSSGNNPPRVLVPAALMKPGPANGEKSGGALLKRGLSFNCGDSPSLNKNRNNSVSMDRNSHHHHGGENKPVIRRVVDSSTPVSGTSPQSSRNRSLSLSLSSNRLSSPGTPSTSPRDRVDGSVATAPVGKNFSRSSHHLDAGRDASGYNYNNSWDRYWDDNESVTSITSIADSVGSCDHASVARNGTTFSGRSMKYVFHCNQYAGVTGDEYLTPTQRVHRQVKKLKHLLAQAKKNLDDKDSDILKLTKEVVELRLYKAALNSPEDRSNDSSDAAVTVREIIQDDHDEPNQTPPEDLRSDPGDESGSKVMSTSYNTDSGHFDDFGNSPIKSRKRSALSSDKSVMTASTGSSEERSHLVLEYEKRVQELIKTHEQESYQLKQRHNDKVEELLQRITEINQRYWELVPELDSAKEKIKELEAQLEDACRQLEEFQQESEANREEKKRRTYLDMYGKHAEDNPKVPEGRISVPELLEELQVTKNELDKIKDLDYCASASPSTSTSLQPLLSAKEALSLWVLGARKAMYRQLMEAKSRNRIDPEITLQFLKSAIYYFLTDKENSQGHLKAIQSILGFSPSEISNIDKARLT